ncbi:type IV pilin N-terminal domain-containing protein [Natronoglomus mannanivorans]|uniref:Type IV pilin N-terminal domain-containing protein n=1 Tax=Natronoglomus mannanivorans TaxID=2979990 RepID=A0AAP2YYJ1_9EURY|nr:type IV pilin N-terminal domain-containing protein [Halobacteria archaeon AArc-xg1-1]
MNLQKKLIGDEDERAVSPVIGVILMVAITVILAAVIAAFVLDLGQSQSSSVNAGVSIDNSSSGVTFQVTDQGNSEEVIIQSDDTGTFTFGSNDNCADSVERGGVSDAGCELSDVGDSVTVHADDNEESFTVIAVAGDNENVIGNHN